MAAAAGWVCDEVREVVFTQPLVDPVAAFGFVDSGFAEPLRAAPVEVRRRVQVRFERPGIAPSLASSIECC
ncbi:MAG: hypothetical protein ACRDTE_15850 [Pseudonocardiaceae bacterium]